MDSIELRPPRPPAFQRTPVRHLTLRICIFHFPFMSSHVLQVFGRLCVKRLVPSVNIVRPHDNSVKLCSTNKL